MSTVRSQREAAREVLRSMARASHREGEEHHSRFGKGAPVRVSFLDAGGGRHPMASLMHSREHRGGGGRGGRTRLALYLSALWVAGGGDHSTTRPASFWARLLGLPDDESTGVRTIRSSWAELVHRGFCTVTPGEGAGAVPTYTLCSEVGNGQPYTIPRGREGDRYFRVPESAWTQGLLGDSELTGPGLAMYLVALRTASLVGRTDSLAFPAAAFVRDVGLSNPTRKKGLRNLDELGILISTPDEPRDDLGERGQRLRPRNIYRFGEGWAPAVTRTPLPSYR